MYLAGEHDENLDRQLVIQSHQQILGTIARSDDATPGDILYSYSRSMNGFAATLNEADALALSQLPQVLFLFVSETRRLHTTRSWGFLGLEAGAGESENENIPPNSLWRKGNFGKDVIIGNLDTGVWPESASFSDTGIGPIPSQWKGICQNGTQCNRKLIGARYFNKGYESKNKALNQSATGQFPSPRDEDGHGTHTLSTAGGNFVRRASLYGYAEGVAKGGAPHARVAAYKVCWPDSEGNIGCDDADILAAFDAGIHDGVDVFSVSLGGSLPRDYFQDAISLGSFHAVQRGKVVVCSAGNAGPAKGTVQNVAPWIITVGASGIDRQFPSSVLLGNNRTYVGQSLAQFQLPKGKLYPLVSSVNVRAPDADEATGQFCLPGGLDPRKVKGKIVACLRDDNSVLEKGETVRKAGGVGMILCNAPKGNDRISANIYPLPATHLTAVDGAAVFDYIKSSKSPVASIYGRTKLNTKPAPVMALFSSQGPNSLTPDILKPDITAPGWNILAAYSEAATATGAPFDNRHVPFNIISGTSMSCPHIAGIAALLKRAYPHWSPAAIRSAIMTTATRLDNTKGAITTALLQKADPFNYGAGHVNPNKAGNPGLVYDLSVEDYYSFFCTLNYNSTQIRAVTGKEISCPALRPKTYDLNYPSITVSKLNGSVIVKRTVTNVAEGPAIYKADVESPDGVLVSVEPQKLEFSKTGEKKSFNVTLTAIKSTVEGYAFGSLTWKHPRYLVVSPIVVTVVAVKTSQEVFE